jgi:hypothetical protein
VSRAIRGALVAVDLAKLVLDRNRDLVEMGTPESDRQCDAE